jgi:UDP-2-acetamido-3-amino-2,3-dideoxy-glucuronate N-acetyltransferase
MKLRKTFIHASAEVHPTAKIGEGTFIWNWSKVRERARVGAACNIGQGVYIDLDTVMGARCKIQNGVHVYCGVTLGDDVFVGPNATFTNDRVPRAHMPYWRIVDTLVEDGASIGANATIVCGIRLGRHCMVAAGAVVTKDVPDFGLVAGCPARLIDYISVSGERFGWKEGDAAPDPKILLDKTVGFEGREDLQG